MASWTFITNHGAALALIGQHHHITARTVAEALGITERSVQRIIRDLEHAGYITKVRDGRANRYQVNEDLPLRRQNQHDILVGELLHLLNRGATKALTTTGGEIAAAQEQQNDNSFANSATR